MRVALQKTNAIYGLAILASLLLSYAGVLRGAVLNPDGICYLQSAATYATSDFSTAMHLCGQAKWPFYSYLIYLFASSTTVSYFSSAFLLDAVFSLISVVTFIYIAKLLGGSKRVLWLAALVILAAHEFNSVREYVIRDHGFWAFYLISFVAFIQFLRTDKLIFALGWGSALVVATLFRIEGALYLLFLPFAVFLQWQQGFLKNIQQYLKLNTVLMALAFAGLIFTMTHHDGIHASRLTELQGQLAHGAGTIVANFKDKAAALSEHVLNVYSARDAKTLLFILLAAWFVLSVVTNVSAIYALLFGYAVSKNIPATDKPAKLTLYAYLIVSAIICAAFLAESMFLSKRYLIALSLVLMMWVPFALDYLISLRKKALLVIVFLFIFASSLGGIIDFGYSKRYLLQAGDWLKDNAPTQAAIYSNDYQVMYYSQHFGNAIFAKENQFLNDPNTISQGKWKQFDFLAVRINKNDSQSIKLLSEIPLQATISFANKRGDQVIIYQVPHQENPS